MLPDVTIALSDEAIKRAGIVITAVESGPMLTTLRLPAVVEPNAYKQVTVTPLVSGRITKVVADLGAHVRQGQTMATVCDDLTLFADLLRAATAAALAFVARAIRSDGVIVSSDRRPPIRPPLAPCSRKYSRAA